MAKSKSILISGNPFVQIRDTKEGDKYTMRLVYNLGDIYEVDANGNKKRRQQWKYEKLNLWLWNKKHLSPAESEHNRVAKEAAKLVREERERQFLSKTQGYTFAVDRNKINLYDWMEDYIKEYVKADERVIRLSIKRFRAFIDSNKRYAIFSKCIHPDQLTPEMVEAFVDKLEADCRGEGAKTLYKRFKKIITAATKQGIFLDNPCDGISAKVEDEGRLKKDVLTADEITRLIQCKFDRQSDDVRRAFLLSLFTGLRYCDVKELRYRNINYEECTLTFQQQKTKRTNTVPLRHDLIALIGRGEPDQLLFHVGSPTACNKALQHWVERAGINKHITWHCARHSFGALTYYNLKDLRATSELLGHADTKVTQIYTKVFDDRKRELVDSLPAIE